MAFKVVNIIDGDTFEVSPPWKWKDQSGIRVKPTGYNITEEEQIGYQRPKDKLKKINIRKRSRIEKFRGYRL